jgi:arylsulfatase A-like enzyme
LQRAGYETAAFTEDALIHAEAGFQRGFGHYWENTTVFQGAGDAPGTFRRALAWLGAHRDRPVFLFAHTYAVHAPYHPSPPYQTMLLDPPNTPDPARRVAYEQEIRELDDELARFIAALDTLLSPERFVLVVTADHGEEFFEHGGFTHNQLYDEVLRIPLLVRWPGHVPAGHTVTADASLVDVVPTVLDLLGIEATSPSGVSLGPLLRGEATTLERSLIFAEAPPSIWSDRTWSAIARSPTVKCFSFEKPSLDRCFDIAADPAEQKPLDTNDERRPLWEAAKAHSALAARGKTDFQKKPPIPSLHDDPERLEKLRALGYVE